MTDIKTYLKAQSQLSLSILAGHTSWTQVYKCLDYIINEVLEDYEDVCIGEDRLGRIFIGHREKRHLMVNYIVFIDDDILLVNERRLSYADIKTLKVVVFMYDGEEWYLETLKDKNECDHVNKLGQHTFIPVEYNKVRCEKCHKTMKVETHLPEDYEVCRYTDMAIDLNLVNLDHSYMATVKCVSDEFINTAYNSLRIHQLGNTSSILKLYINGKPIKGEYCKIDIWNKDMSFYVTNHKIKARSVEYVYGNTKYAKNIIIGVNFIK